MTLAELAKKVNEKTGTGEKEVQKVIGAALDAIAEALVEGEKVQLTGFGTFSTRVKPAREIKSSIFSEGKITVAERRVAEFKAGKGLKEKVSL